MNTFNIEEASEFLGAHRETIRRMAASGELPAVKIGRDWVFLEQDFVMYIRNKYSTFDASQGVNRRSIDIWHSTKDVFNNIKSSFNEAIITFDYFPQKMVDMIARYAKEGSNESLWKTGIDDLKRFAEQTGLTIIVEPKSIGELSREYDVDNNPSDGANNYFVCALGNK